MVVSEVMSVKVSLMSISSGRLLCMKGWWVCENMKGSIGRM